MPPLGLIFNLQKFSLHDGPGIRTVVFFKGCPLACSWCSNPEARDGNPCPEARRYTLEEALGICLQDRLFYEETGGVTLSGGEALAQGDFALELLRALKGEKIHTAVETSGFASPKVFGEICEAADLLLFDVKHFDDSRHIAGTGVPNGPILDNLRTALARKKNTLVRVPVVPGYNNSPDDARGFASLFEALGVGRVQLLPFHQFGKKKYETLGLSYALRESPQLHPEDLKDFREIVTRRGIGCFF